MNGAGAHNATQSPMTMQGSAPQPNVVAQQETQAAGANQDDRVAEKSANSSTRTAVEGSRPPSPTSQVNVKKAEAEFEEMRRTLSRVSSRHRASMNGDVEKADDDEFDLLDYMRSTASAQGEAGFQRKALGVIWDNLTVTGAGGMKIHIRTFPAACMQFALAPVFMIMQRMKKYQPQAVNLLEDFNGYARPGEMVFVLGRPGSGCTTFLKNIANRRGGYLAVNGDISYGGIDAETMGKHYRGEVVYNMEDDIHNAQLTVAQTLRFALNLKAPAKLLPKQTLGDFKEQVLELLLKMLGMPHTKNTKVGSAQVRGVSGGERKRVSIAEMMTTRASVCSWDNSSRGLDASTALDFAKSLRIVTDVFDTTTFVSLYQAGEGIYEQFDKVLVIDKGREVYFGPANEARQYFINLGFENAPRQTTADYLTGCTDENERQYQKGRDASNTPSTPDQLAEAFKKSEIYSRMMKEREIYREEIQRDNQKRDEFRGAVSADKRRLVSNKSPYTVSFWTQVRALTIRQFQLKMQDRLDLIVSYATSIIIALVAGSLFYQLPETTSGAFTRGGVIFISILFNSFQAFNELPTQMMGRPILWKQVNYAFYRPAALSVAAQLADAPFNIVQIFIFSIIIYFMTGLYPSAGAFFAFYVSVLMGYFSLATFFRLLGTMCMNYDIAARVASVLITLFVTYSGYLIPVFSMKRWLFWIYYLNPVNYAFGATMENEFRHLQLECDAASIVPTNIAGLTQYPAGVGPNQVCTLQGAVAGQDYVEGSAYLASAFQYYVSNQWRNWGICLVFAVAFLAFQAWMIEIFKHGADAPAINVFRKEDKKTRALNKELQDNKAAFRRGEREQDLSDLIHTRKPFTWEKVRYTVPVSGGQKLLLDDVYGYVKPGELTALMGSSGAGKTTLLDVLANRKNIGVVEGDILINGRPLGIDFQRGTAYVEQLDVHEWTATIREAFRFSAYLRQPAHIPKAEKDQYVEDVIQLLELEDLADAMIGFPGFGLDVEARKRVTIGVELASKPQLLLFCDEPTSGLDGQSAFNIVRFLRKLAAAGQAILCTIHQPNALLFENFDRLLLLQRGGQTVYFGGIGKDSHILRDYLSRNGAECPPNANPAEYMLEAIGAGSRKRVGDKDWAERWVESPEFSQVKEEIQKLKAEALAKPDEASEGKGVTQYATPLWTQLQVVGERTFISFYRRPDYGLTRVIMHVAIALLVGLTFLNLNDSVGSLQYRVFAVFYVTVLPAIIISMVEPTYILARDTFVREASSKMYSEVVFAMTQLMAEMPYSIISAVCFYLLWYFPMGFSKVPSRAGYQFFFILLAEIFSVTLGQMVAALSPSIYIAAMCNPFLLVVLTVFCGVVVPPQNMIYFWRSWMYPLDPFTRIISGMVSTELYQQPVVCQPGEFYEFAPPAGQTCDEWAGPFVSAGQGYLQDPASTTNCQYCPYETGAEFYNNFGISFDERWRDLGIFIAYIAFNMIVTLVAARYLKYAKR